MDKVMNGDLAGWLDLIHAFEDLAHSQQALGDSLRDRRASCGPLADTSPAAHRQTGHDPSAERTCECSCGSV